VPASGHGYAYEKLKRKVGDYATAAAAVVLTNVRWQDRHLQHRPHQICRKRRCSPRTPAKAVIGTKPRCGDTEKGRGCSGRDPWRRPRTPAVRRIPQTGRRLVMVRGRCNAPRPEPVRRTDAKTNPPWKVKGAEVEGSSNRARCWCIFIPREI